MSLSVVNLHESALEEATALLHAACRFDRAAEVAAEKLFGASPPPAASLPLGVHEDGRLVGVAAAAGRWLRLLAVHPFARGRGAGSALLARALEGARAAGERRLRTCDQPGNYLAPGVDARDRDTLEWLWRRGFRRVAENENLAVPLEGNALVTAARAALLAEEAAAHGYEIRRAHVGDATALDALVRSRFSVSWAFEVSRALANDRPAVHIAILRGEIVAFAAHDGNNRGLGWFGPAGTLDEHRGRGLGQALLLPCLLDVAAAGNREAVIAWIGPRRFYERAAGAVPGRRFVVLERDA